MVLGDYGCTPNVHVDAVLIKHQVVGGLGGGREGEMDMPSTKEHPFSPRYDLSVVCIRICTYTASLL